MTDTFHKRRERAANLMTRAGNEALAIVPGPNFVYLTGLNFHLMERPTILILTAQGEISAIMPALEQLKWMSAYPDATTFFWQDSDGFEAAFAAAGKKFGKLALGIEGGRMRMFEYDAMCRHMHGGSVSNADAVFADLRMAKDQTELSRLERAIAISETSLAETLDGIKVGSTEKRVRNLLKSRMLENGADGFSFDPIVLAGGKAANPHGVVDDTGICPGDVVLIDFGAQVAGYNADITRTFFVDHVSDEHAAIYETVLRANEEGRRVCGPGLTADELDTIVTGVLRESPFADLIVHKTGHGLGLEVHEPPQIMIGNRQELVPGTVVTIEPGLYRAHDVGVRIEDDVLVADSGSRSLTGFDRKLQILN